jgi:hypothetical protein
MDTKDTKVKTLRVSNQQAARAKNRKTDRESARRRDPPGEILMADDELRAAALDVRKASREPAAD